MSRALRTIDIALGVFVVVVLVVVILAVVRGGKTRSQECVAQGGHVTSEVEYKRGKRYTEYECIVNGDEVDEWKVRG